MASSSDVSIVRLRLNNLAFARKSAARFLDPAPTDDQLRTFLANDANVLVTAIENDMPVGQAIGYRLDRLDGAKPMLYLYAIIVSEDYRRRGIGGALIDFMRHIGIDDNCEFMFATTNANNACAMRLYQHTNGLRPHTDDALFVYEFGTEGLVIGPSA